LYARTEVVNGGEITNQKSKDKEIGGYLTAFQKISRKNEGLVTSLPCLSLNVFFLKIQSISC
jgi:hypothetical protein